MLERVELTVDTATAAAFNAADEATRRTWSAFFVVWMQQQANPRPLPEVLDDLSRAAAARGLTEADLSRLLTEDDDAS